MKHILRLALYSAWNRRSTLMLMLVAIMLSTMLLLGIERIREQIRAGFAQSVSGTDLIVGARTSSVQLMLYSVFRVGGATNNISWESVERISQYPQVDWVIPISLGDSHRGFPVLATNEGYFEHFRYGGGKGLQLSEGKVFSDLYDAVLGADVAQQLGYQLGDPVVLAHGSGQLRGRSNEHADKPFTVTGILRRTGTPVDRTVHICLQGMEAIHLGWQGGAPISRLSISADTARRFDLTPKSVTAAFVGLKLRSQVFGVQRRIAQDPDEALMAVLPGVALDELWSVISFGENSLRGVSLLVMLVSLAGLASCILAGLGERRHELAVLRSVGAKPRDILLLLAFEGLWVMLTGVLAGFLLLTFVSIGLGPMLETYLGVKLAVGWPVGRELWMLALLVSGGFVVGLIPGIRAYRQSLADGLILNR